MKFFIPVLLIIMSVASIALKQADKSKAAPSQEIQRDTIITDSLIVHGVLTPSEWAYIPEVRNWEVHIQTPGGSIAHRTARGHWYVDRNAIDTLLEILYKDDSLKGAQLIDCYRKGK